VFFLLLVVARTICVLLIFLAVMGWDPMVASLLLFFWTLPVFIVVFALGVIEIVLGKYGTFVTSLGSLIPLVLFRSDGNGAGSWVFDIYTPLAMYWSIMWIASGLLLRPPSVRKPFVSKKYNP
jgi:hypothetical protein